MNTLEVLLNAERSLMDPDEPFHFGEWAHCTCGHIYHGVIGEYGTSGEILHNVYLPTNPYSQVMSDVVEALGLGGKSESWGFNEIISEHTKKLSGIKYEPGHFPYGMVTREVSLKVIREAISKIREMDQVVIKSLDAHNHEVI